MGLDPWGFFKGIITVGGWSLTRVVFARSGYARL